MDTDRHLIHFLDLRLHARDTTRCHGMNGKILRFRCWMIPTERPDALSAVAAVSSRVSVVGQRPGDLETLVPAEKCDPLTRPSPTDQETGWDRASWQLR